MTNVVATPSIFSHVTDEANKLVITFVVGTRGNARYDPEQRTSPHLTAALRTPLCGKQIRPTASSKSAAPRMMSISKRR